MVSVSPVRIIDEFPDGFDCTPVVITFFFCHARAANFPKTNSSFERSSLFCSFHLCLQNALPEHCRLRFYLPPWLARIFLRPALVSFRPKILRRTPEDFSREK